MADDAVHAYLKAIGRKGGLVSGSRRMVNFSQEQRRSIAAKAARARWGNKTEVWQSAMCNRCGREYEYRPNIKSANLPCQIRGCSGTVPLKSTKPKE